MADDAGFRYEIEESQDEKSRVVTTVKCHGRLVSASASAFKDAVKPLIARGGRIVLDFGELEYLDSSGLGAVVGLKVSSLGKEWCSLELMHLSPRVRQLISMTNLVQLFSIESYPGSAFALHHEALVRADREPEK